MPQVSDSTAWMCSWLETGVGVVLVSAGAVAGGLVLLVVLAAIARRALKCMSPRHAHLAAVLASATGFAFMSGGCVLYLSSSTWANGERVELYGAVFVGALVFAASGIAFGKLRGALSLKTMALPGHGIVNLMAVLLCGWLGYGFVTEQAQPFGLAALLATSALACAIGVHMTTSREYSAGHALATGKSPLLSRIEWHDGEEPAWVLRDMTPGTVRAAAYRHRRDWHNGKGNRHRSGRFATRRLP